MNDALLAELLEMKQRDQALRSRLVAEGRLYTGYDDELGHLHRQNARRLDEILAQSGWPGLSQVGLEGSRAAWLIAQHAIDLPELQCRFLAALSEAVATGEAPKPQLAMLTDRVRFNQQRPQLYGTVLDWDDAGVLGCEVEDPENLNARRREMGLTTSFEDDLAAQRIAVAAEQGETVRDYARLRREGLAWARQVGWIP